MDQVLVSVRCKTTPNEIVDQFVLNLEDVSLFIATSKLDKDHYIIVEQLKTFTYE